MEDIFTFYREEINPEFAIIWSKIVENPEYSDSFDVRLECTDGQSCQSHRSLLSMSSDCFRDAFDFYYNNRPEEQSPDDEMVIGLPDSVPFEELHSIIDYIYKGIVSIPESRVLRFLEVSRFLAINGLEDIRLVYMDNMDNFNRVLASNQTSVRCKPNYNFHFKDSDESEFQYSSDDSMELNLSSNAFTKIKERPNKGLPIVRTNHKHIFGKSLIDRQHKPRKVGLQGRKPQVGSPLITEDFKSGDRYQCKVCFRSYLWKKSLVRHYKDLHPNCVELVAE